MAEVFETGGLELVDASRGALGIRVHFADFQLLSCRCYVPYPSIIERLPASMPTLFLFFAKARRQGLLASVFFVWRFLVQPRNLL